MIIYELIDIPVIEYFNSMKKGIKRDKANYKKMSIFSDDHLIVASDEGLHYLDLENQDKDPLFVNAT